MVGGTGSGKTWVAPRWIYRKLTENPGARALCIGLGYDKHVERVMVEETTKMLREWRVKYDYNKRTYNLTLPNGSQMLFGSSENPLSLEGAHLEYCWMDEAALMGVDTFDVAQRRTGYASDGMGQILITTIPYSENWLRRDVYDPWTKGDPSIEWIAMRTKDNPRYPVAEVERMKRKNYQKYLIYYEGQWGRMEGLIFPDPPDAELIVDPFVIPQSWPCFAGHDFGYNAPTTGVWGRLDPLTDILYLVADYEARKMTFEDHLEEWDELGLTYVDEAFCDPANPEVWARAQESGYSTTPAVNRVTYGIDCVKDRLLSGRLKVFKGCRRVLDYRATYRWKAKKESEDHGENGEDGFTDAPLKPQPAEHIMDALRYLCTGLVESGISRVPDPVIITRSRGIG